MKKQIIVMVMLFAFVFAGNAVYAQANNTVNQQEFNKAIVSSIINLSSKITSGKVSQEKKCALLAERMDKYESYYAQPVSDPTLKLLYAVDYFQDAQDMEKECLGGAKKTRYDFIRWEYFGRMQETILGAYEKCVDNKLNRTDDPFSYRYIATYERVLSAFKDSMQPEALTHFNKLTAMVK